MRKYSIPTASVAIAKDGRLVHARAFGYQDLAKTKPVTPASRFRIASNSKPITAVAVLLLSERGRLKLEDRAFDILAELTPPKGARVDPRLRTIALRQLLEHSAGFDSTKTDPQFDRTARGGRGVTAPCAGDPRRHRALYDGSAARFRSGIEVFVLQSGLQYSGSRHRARQRRTVRNVLLARSPGPGGHHADAARSHEGVGAPGRRGRMLGRPVDAAHVLGVRERPATGAHVLRWIFDGSDRRARRLARERGRLDPFLNAVGGERTPRVLQAETVREMWARPNLPQYRDGGKYYALGWDVVPGKEVAGHNGAITFGTLSCVRRLPRGITVAANFNRLPFDIVTAVVDIEQTITREIGAITDWPDVDLYRA